ncbi:hypothetical protein JHK87_009838 [Glycine soja]|nr:hypothetical protein JHK87_009838 [Glycine soja]
MPPPSKFKVPSLRSWRGPDRNNGIPHAIPLVIRVGSLHTLKLLKAKIDKSVLHKVAMMDRFDTMEFLLERYDNDG